MFASPHDRSPTHSCVGAAGRASAIAILILAILLGAMARPSEAQPAPRPQFANPDIDEWRRDTSLRIYRQVRLLGRLSVTGRTLIGLRVDRSGRLVESKVLKSSGNTELDGAFLAVVRTAAPFPPLPAAYPGATQSFSLPMASRVSMRDIHGMRPLRPSPGDF